MDYQNLQNALRDRLSGFSRKIEAACAQGLTDLPKLSENLAGSLLRELMGFRNLRNLNGEQKKNFPALDLADDKLKLGGLQRLLRSTRLRRHSRRRRAIDCTKSIRES